MALPTNNSRPSIPYVPQQILPNSDRYGALGQFPPTAQQLDGDLNKMIDLINTLSDEINKIVVGALPGAEDPLNANRLMTTDGAGNISWVKVGSANLDAGAVTTAKIAEAAITPEKIQPQAITTDKLANNAVTSNKIPNTSLPGAKLLNQTITTAQIANQTITAAQIANNTISQAQIDAAFAQSLVPTGCVMPFAATNAPDGWIACTGVAVSRQTYAALFAVIGTTYGAGDGSTTFNVPDLRGRAMFGFIGGSTNNLITGATADKLGLGGKGGEETHVLTEREMPTHSHSLSGFTNYTYPNGNISGAVGGNALTYNATKPTTNTGGNQAHNNMPPFILMNFIIKT